MKSKPERLLKTDWPEGTKFAYSDAEKTPYAYVPYFSQWWKAILPDGTLKLGSTYADDENPVSREDFDRLAQIWISTVAPEPRELKTDWPEDTKFELCDSDGTPFAWVRVEGGWKTFNPDGSPRRGICSGMTGRLTREEFDRLAVQWALSPDFDGWTPLSKPPAH